MKTAIPLMFLLVLAPLVLGAPKGERYAPDHDSPGDAMIQTYLAHEAERISGRFMDGIGTAEEWMAVRERLRPEYLYMLGLWPLPEKTPLKPTVTRLIPGKDYVVEVLHFQSRPGLYVTANLYRPPVIEPGQKLPGVLYVCGHWSRGRDGGKTGFQPHGLWYARHGYVCLIVDTLQLGEIAGIHHGTYREGRWWWHSRGYTPAGVECWNGIRAIDYLTSRPEVDSGRIAVTGISGGGAATFWIAAADERVAVAVPVSGMADLTCYVGERLVNGHCDCMFMYNTFQWPWTRIAAMVAPRPLLFVNSDQDPIFPMDANERIINRLERLYSLFGASDRVDAVVSIGGHAYRKDNRQAGYRFINSWLKNEPRPVEDSEVDLITKEDDPSLYPISPSDLRAFPTDSDIPKDQINTTVDRQFVPTARVEAPASGQFALWQQRLMDEFRRVSFHGFPDRIPPGRMIDAAADGRMRLATEVGIECWLRPVGEAPSAPGRVLMTVAGSEKELQISAELEAARGSGDLVFVCEPRGIGRTRWTRKDPPNYVERTHTLIGRTVDAGRVWDVVAAARYLAARRKLKVYLAGEGAGGLLAAYAALLEPEVEGLVVLKPPGSHMEAEAPQFLSVLRVCDVPEALGMLAPRPLQLLGAAENLSARVRACYAAAGASASLTVR